MQSDGMLALVGRSSSGGLTFGSCGLLSWCLGRFRILIGQLRLHIFTILGHLTAQFVRTIYLSSIRNLNRSYNSSSNVSSGLLKGLKVLAITVRGSPKNERIRSM